MLKTAAILTLLAVVAVHCATDYCKICSDHTMCINESPGPMCNPLLKSGVGSKERQEILDVHNELRAKVATGQQNGQPGAANMRKMTWDSQLAKVAQRWADQCNYGHDYCRDVPRFSVGQNIYGASSSYKTEHSNWRDVVVYWYNEVIDFNPDNIKPFQFSAPTDHYTQVVWAETNKVGCGFAKFPEHPWIKSFYVCNYGPAGNVQGGTMYEEGAPCTQCVPGTTVCEAGLCV